MDKLVASKKINGALVISAGYLGGIPLAGIIFYTNLAYA